VLFYIIEEAVNNARKHAQSEHIWVRLGHRESFVVVEIEDDGVGFDVGAVDASYDRRGSLGMVNMRERAELIEGTLRIQSAKGSGTKISILVPAHPVGEIESAGGTAEPAAPLQLQNQRTGAQRPVETPAESAQAARPKLPARPQVQSAPTPPPGRPGGTGQLRAAAEQADKPRPGVDASQPSRPAGLKQIISDSQVSRPKSPAPPSASPPGPTRKE
jgi:hypothetical protein